MGAPTSLLGNARAFARDFPRDNMPQGYLWDVVDFVPQIIDAGLSSRGKWSWGSVATGQGGIESGILATFPTGEQLLVQTANDRLMKLNEGGVDQATWTWTDLAATFFSPQNPVQLFETVVHTDHFASRVPQLWRDGAVLNADVSMAWPRVATVWQGVLISGGGKGPAGVGDEGDVIRYSLAGQDLATAAAFDTNAFDHTSGRVTGLQALRSMVLIFHPGSVERLRGGPFPNTAASEEGGLILDSLFDKIGCSHPRSIATWNDNCIWANERGVHITDGAVARDLTSQGGISYYWRLLYEGAETIAATTFLDYYIVTVRHPPLRPPLPDSDKGHGENNGSFASSPPLGPSPAEVPRPPVPPQPDDLPEVRPPPPELAGDAYTTTLVCDLNRKQWFRISNCNAITYISSVGSDGMERVWGGFSGIDRIVRMGPMFYPDESVAQIDDNGYVVKPRFETPWYRLGKEGRKRLRFGYLSYDCRTIGASDPIRISYAINPQSGGFYNSVGGMPSTGEYRRYRFPINRSPYGVMFLVEAIEDSNALRIFDLAIEGEPKERSRV